MSGPEESDEVEILGIEAVDEAGRPLPDEMTDVDPSGDETSRAAESVPVNGATIPLREFEALTDRYLRLRAEFDNYRRRRDREAEDSKAEGATTILREFLPCLDSLERAIAILPEGTPDGVRQGIDLILKQLREAGRRAGVEEIEALGERFDPQVHEAVMTVDGNDFPGFEDGSVVEQLQRGYQYRGRLVRPALVKVLTRAPEESTQESDPGEEILENQGRENDSEAPSWEG